VDFRMLLTNLQAATMTGGYGIVPKAAVLIEDGRIAWVGPTAEAPAASGLDCGGRLLTPGLIDCHTHLVYGGNRANEFELRLTGVPYAEIAKARAAALQPPSGQPAPNPQRSFSRPHQSDSIPYLRKALRQSR
jgi:imidazolonepropionase